MCVKELRDLRFYGMPEVVKTKSGQAVGSWRRKRQPNFRFSGRLVLLVCDFGEWCGLVQGSGSRLWERTRCGWECRECKMHGRDANRISLFAVLCGLPGRDWVRWV